MATMIPLKGFSASEKNEVYQENLNTMKWLKNTKWWCIHIDKDKVYIYKQMMKKL